MSMNLDYADGWRPEEGDTLIGTITDVSVGVSSVNGASYPIITVQPESGGDPVAVHGFHAGLFNRLTELRPRTGERIGFQFKGKRPHKTQPGKEVAVYAVKVDRPDGGGDDVWNRLDAPAQQPAPVTPQQRATDAPVTAQDFSAVDTSGDDDIPF